MKRGMGQLACAVGIALAVIAVAGCVAVATQNALGTFVDHFDDETSGWESASGAVGSVGYQNGEYEIRIDRDWWVRRTWSPMEDPLSNFRVEATAYFVSEGQGSELGICWGFDTANVYFAGIKDDGTYAVGHLSDNEWQENLIDWTESRAIALGVGRNRLEVIVEEGRATILVNGTELASTVLTMEGPYVIGLYGATYGIAPAIARFTEFVVRDLGDSRTVAATDVLKDDFDDEVSGWVSNVDADGSSTYEGGEYEIGTQRMYGQRISWAPLTEPLENFRVKVSGHLHSGPLVVEYGIVWGTDEGNAYYVGVTAEGEYSVGRTDAGLWEEPRPIAWTSSSALLAGDGVNSLELTIQGQRATLTINDRETVTLDVTAEGPSRIGLYVSSHSFSPAAVRFAHFEVAELAAPEVPTAYVDRFDDESGWEVASDFLSAARYADDEYEIEIKRRFWLRESWPPFEAPLETFRVETTGYVNEGADDTRWGIVVATTPKGIINEVDVRIHSDTAYYVSISRDGQYAVGLAENRVWQPAVVDFASSPAIQTGDAGNHLVLSVRNGWASLSVNDVDLASFELTVSGPYYVGLVAITGELPAPSVRFTEFRVEDLSGGKPKAVAEVEKTLEGLGFDEFVEVSYRVHALREPQHVAAMGMAEAFGIRNDGLDDYSYEYAQETFAIETLILERLRAFDPAELTEERRATYEICEWYWDDVVRGQAFHEYEHLVHSMTAFSAIGYLEYVLNEAHPFGSESDVVDYVARLQRVGAQIDQLIVEMERRMDLGIAPPRRTLQAALPALQRSADARAEAHPFYETLATKAAMIEGLSSIDLEGYLLLGRISVELVVKPAYQRLHDALEELADAAPEAISIGQLDGGHEAYAYLLRHHTQTELTASQIHDVGLREVSRVQDEIRRAAESIGIEDTSTMLAIFQAVGERSESVQGQEAIDENTRLIREAERLVIESGALSSLPEATVMVEGADYGGFYLPASLDGARPAKFLASTANPSALFKLPTVAYHEAVPGHHLQIALAQEMELPLIRRDVVFNGFAEGWALYAERLMSELGAFADDSLGNLGRLQLELMRAVRLVVDTGIHELGWSYDEAVAYVAENAGESEGMAAYRVTRYSVVPGQATAYMVGLLEILELRGMAREALGDAFDLAAFHDVILGNGTVPLTFLRDLVEVWIAKQKDAMGGS